MLFRMFSLALLALAPIVMGTTLVADDYYQDGKLVSTADNKITVTCPLGKEYTFTLSPSIKVKWDGRTCKCEELTPGVRIRVFTSHDDRQQATAIEAIDKIIAFDGAHDGKLVSITETTLMMTGKNGKEHSHVLSADTRLILDGQPVKWDALKAGNRIRVTTRTEQTQTVIRIEALDKQEQFAGTKDGKYVSNAKNQLVMTNSEGNEQSLQLSCNVSVMCDGQACKLDDLKPGTRIRIISLTEDHALINRIDALVKKNAFDILD